LDEVVAQQRGQRRRGRLVAGGPGSISGHWLSGALLCRLRSRWTKQRWRTARGKHLSTTRIRPDAPSVKASSGSGRPRGSPIELVVVWRQPPSQRRGIGWTFC
jgi:hypothetical protein